jgi:transglutaminase-like putative cysteine protease
VYLAVARASGIPARDVYGLRMASPKTGEITGDFHCWLEFYLPGTGWVPMDPADVRKAMLTEKLELKDAGKWVEFFWGGDNLFRIALNRGARDMVLSDATEAEPLTYFMYPYAEVNGEVKDFFSPTDFKYTVTLNLDSANSL